MERPHSCPPCRPNTVVATFSKNAVAHFAGLLKAIEHRIKTQRRNKEDLPVY